MEIGSVAMMNSPPSVSYEMAGDEQQGGVKKPVQTIRREQPPTVADAEIHS